MKQAELGLLFPQEYPRTISHASWPGGMAVIGPPTNQEMLDKARILLNPSMDKNMGNPKDRIKLCPWCDCAEGVSQTIALHP